MSFKRAELPEFSERHESASDGPALDGGPDVRASIFSPKQGPIPSFGKIPYPPTQNPPVHAVPPCMFHVDYRVTTLYDQVVVEMRGIMYRHPTLIASSCPPGTENYTKPGTNLWAMVQAEMPSKWSLRSEANYEQPLFNGQASQIGFIPFVSTGFDKSGGYLSFFVPQRGHAYHFSVWLRDATHGRDLLFGPQAQPQAFQVAVR